MSSIASSPLTLDLKPAGVPLAAVGLWLTLIVVGIWCSAAPWPLQCAVTVTIVATAIGVLHSQLFGYMGSSLSHATLHPDGSWRLADSHGRQWDAALSPASRVMAGWALLRWKSPPGSRWALLAQAGSNRTIFRRLRVRLRFS